MKTENILVDNWIPCEVAMPIKPIKVYFKYQNGKEDCGWFNGKDFCTIDPICEDVEIISWKPMDLL